MTPRWPVPSIPIVHARRSRPATPVEMAILDALRTRGELSTTQVADATGRSMGRVCKVLYRLKSAGLVLQRDVADRVRFNVTWSMWRIRVS